MSSSKVMTTIWGPLGWMTLHSMASIYPDEPSQSEKHLMNVWIDMFRDTITCPSCKDHFTSLLAVYRRDYKDMLASRRDFLLFTFRAHNAVNQRISKPVYGSATACFEQLRNNVKSRSAHEFRAAYINHIRRFWRTFQDISGITALKKINEMAKIENEYAGPKTNNFEVGIEEGNVVVGLRALDPNAEQPSPVRILPRALPGGFRLTSAGLRFR